MGGRTKQNVLSIGLVASGVTCFYRVSMGAAEHALLLYCLHGGLA